MGALLEAAPDAADEAPVPSVAPAPEVPVLPPEPAPEPVAVAPAMTRPEDYVNHSLYFEAKTFLHGLFVVEDKISMAHGLAGSWTALFWLRHDPVTRTRRSSLNCLS